MAIRWKKYEMYGPKKPGVIKKCFWFCKEKCTTITGLYGVSVILLMIFVWNHQFGFLGLYGKAD